MTALRRYLKRERLSQAEFARRMGISTSLASYLLSGERQASWRLAARLAKKTGLSIMDFVPRELDGAA